MKKNLKVRLIGNDDEVLYFFDAQLQYESEDDEEGELNFIQPLTGEMYTNIDHCLSGWGEMDKEQEDARQKLADLIRNDEFLLSNAWISDEDDNLDYHI